MGSSNGNDGQDKKIPESIIWGPGTGGFTQGWCMCDKSKMILAEGAECGEENKIGKRQQNIKFA